MENANKVSNSKITPEIKLEIINQSAKKGCSLINNNIEIDIKNEENCLKNSFEHDQLNNNHLSIQNFNKHLEPTDIELKVKKFQENIEDESEFKREINDTLVTLKEDLQPIFKDRINKIENIPININNFNKYYGYFSEAINNLNENDDYKNNKKKHAILNKSCSRIKIKFKKEFRASKEDIENTLNLDIFVKLHNATKIESEEIREERIKNIIFQIAEKTPPNSLREFYNYISSLKRVLGYLKRERRLRLDSLLKKCKSKFFQAIQESMSIIYALNFGENKLSPKIESIKKLNEMDNIEKFFNNKIPQSFIANVNIVYNNKYLNKTLRTIYEDFDMFQISKFYSFSYESILDLLNPEQKKNFICLMNMTFIELYNSYINSKRFKKDYYFAKSKYGEQYSYLFLFVCHIYIKYFSYDRKLTYERIPKELFTTIKMKRNYKGEVLKSKEEIRNEIKDF